jgi:serine/threonine-protein kinase RsbW
MRSGGRTSCRPARRRNTAGSVRRRRIRELVLAFGPGDLPALRARVTAYATRFVAGERLADLVLVVHELAANVIRHGGGQGRLRLWWEGGRAVCRVSDSGPGLSGAVSDGSEPPSPGTPGGRGLWIARRLSVLWIETGPAGTTVTAIMPLT